MPFASTGTVVSKMTCVEVGQLLEEEIVERRNPGEVVGEAPK